MPRGKTKDRDGIYQRKDRPGWWASWIDASGKRRQRKLEAHTLTQARKLLADEKEKADKQRTTGIVPPTKDSFAEFADVFIDYQRRRIAPKPAKWKISQTEFNRQKGIIEAHLKPFFGKMKLALIRKKDVNDYIDSRIGAVSDGTVIKEMNCLKRLFAVAVNKEKITTNPAHGADVPEAPKGRNRYLLPNELGKVLRACPEWLRPIVGLAVSLGTRRGELLRVRWEDVDIDSGQILLRHTKNGQERPAFINDLALQVLTSLGVGKKKKGLLFPNVTPPQVSVAFIRACQEAGIEDFSLHDLRHTFASHARMNGVDLHTLQKLLGHSDPRMTDVYANLSQTFLLDAAKRLDGVLSLAPAPDEDADEKATAHPAPETGQNTLRMRSIVTVE
jgi:integrase